MRNCKRIVCLLLALCLCAGLLTGCGKDAGRQQVELHVYHSEMVDTGLDKLANNGFNNTVIAGDYLYAVGWNSDDATGEWGAKLLRVKTDGTGAEELPLPEHPYNQNNGNMDIYPILGPDGQARLLCTVNDYGNEENDYNYTQQYFADTLGPDGRVVDSVALQVPEETWLNFWSACYGADGTLWCSTDGGLLAIAPDGSSRVVEIAGIGYAEQLLSTPDGMLLSYRDEEEWNRHIAPIQLPEGKLGEELTLPENMRETTLLSSPGGTLYFQDSFGIYSYDQKAGTAQMICSWLDSDLDSSYDVGQLTANDDGSFTAIANGENWDKLLINTLTYVDPATLPEKTILSLGCIYSWRLQREVLRFNRASDTVRITLVDYSSYNNEENQWNGAVTQLNNDIITGKVPDILAVDSSLPFQSYLAKGLFTDLYPLLDADETLQREDFLPNVLQACENDGKLYSVIPYFDLMTAIVPAGTVGDEPGWTWDEFLQAVEQRPELEQAILEADREQLLIVAILLGGDQFVDFKTGTCHFDTPAFQRVLEYVATYPEEYDYGENYVEPKEQFASGKVMMQAVSLWSFDSVRDYTYNLNGPIVYKGFPTGDGSVGSAIQPYMQLAISEACPDKTAAWQFVGHFLSKEYQAEEIGGDFALRVDVLQEMADEAMKDRRSDDFARALSSTAPVAVNDDVAVDSAPPATADAETAEGETAESTTDDEAAADTETQPEEPVAEPALPIDDIMMPSEDYWNRPLTQAEVDALMDAIAGATTLWQYDTSLFDIIAEETPSFYDGTKSVAEVCNIIQDRVSTYLSESR